MIGALHEHIARECESRRQLQAMQRRAVRSTALHSRARIYILESAAHAPPLTVRASPASAAPGGSNAPAPAGVTGVRACVRVCGRPVNRYIVLLVEMRVCGRPVNRYIVLLVERAQLVKEALALFILRPLLLPRRTRDVRARPSAHTRGVWRPGPSFPYLLQRSLDYLVPFVHFLISAFFFFAFLTEPRTVIRNFLGAASQDGCRCRGQEKSG